MRFTHGFTLTEVFQDKNINTHKQHLLSSLWQQGWKNRQLAVNAIVCVFKRNVFHFGGLVLLSGS